MPTAKQAWYNGFQQGLQWAVNNSDSLERNSSGNKGVEEIVHLYRGQLLDLWKEYCYEQKSEKEVQAYRQDLERAARSAPPEIAAIARREIEYMFSDTREESTSAEEEEKVNDWLYENPSSQGAKAGK